MKLFDPGNWPLLFICLGMIFCAAVDGWKFKVPNLLTFPLIFSGWALALGHDLGVYPDASSTPGGIWEALAGTLIGFLLLFPLWVIGGVGTGDVKMQMGFGSWVGAFYGFPHCVDIIFYSFVAGTISGGIIALGMIFFRGQVREHLANCQDILRDLASIKSLGLEGVNERARKRKPSLCLLPYGIPLCMGTVGYLFFCNR